MPCHTYFSVRIINAGFHWLFQPVGFSLIIAVDRNYYLPFANCLSADYEALYVYLLFCALLASIHTATAISCISAPLNS